jgi:hypothetical protein
MKLTLFFSGTASKLKFLREIRPDVACKLDLLLTFFQIRKGPRPPHEPRDVKTFTMHKARVDKQCRN